VLRDVSRAGLQVEDLDGVYSFEFRVNQPYTKVDSSAENLGKVQWKVEMGWVLNSIISRIVDNILWIYLFIAILGLFYIFRHFFSKK